MLSSLARVFVIEPARGLVRFTRGELATCVRLFTRVFHPDLTEAPSQESIVERAGQFFRFLSHWVILQVSIAELSGTDSDLAVEATKYFQLLLTYLFGFSLNYGIVAVGRAWSKNDYHRNANSVADFYNLFFWIAFVINLVFGRIDVRDANSGGMQFRVLLTSFFVLGTAFFVVLRVRKIPLHAFTWFLIMILDVLIHTFNMAMLSQIAYQAI